MKIGLIACSKEKIKLTLKAPARDMYQGDLFKKARAYAEKHYDKWYILSAKYGLLRPDQVIPQYNVTLKDMTPKEREAWAARVADQLNTELNDDLGIHAFFIHAGREYRRVCKYIPYAEIPLEGLGIGQQKAWYKKRGF